MKPKKMKNAPEALDNKAKPVDQEGNNADKPVEKKLTPDEIHKRNQELIKARQRDLKNNITNFIKSAYIKSINENINDKVNDDIIKTVCSKEQDNVNNLVNKIEDEFINKIKISEISDDGKHYKWTYYGDHRYVATAAKTCSDGRAGINLSSIIEN